MANGGGLTSAEETPAVREACCRRGQPRKVKPAERWLLIAATGGGGRPDGCRRRRQRVLGVRGNVMRADASQRRGRAGGKTSTSSGTARERSDQQSPQGSLLAGQRPPGATTRGRPQQRRNGNHGNGGNRNPPHRRDRRQSRSLSLTRDEVSLASARRAAEKRPVLASTWRARRTWPRRWCIEAAALPPRLSVRHPRDAERGLWLPHATTWRAIGDAFKTAADQGSWVCDEVRPALPNNSTAAKRTSTTASTAALRRVQGGRPPHAHLPNERPAMEHGRD